MASTSYLLEELPDKGRPEKLGAFTTMDKAITAAKAHIHWSYISKGKVAPEIRQVSGAASTLLWTGDDRAGLFYEITKLRTR